MKDKNGRELSEKDYVKGNDIANGMETCQVASIDGAGMATVIVSTIVQQPNGEMKRVGQSKRKIPVAQLEKTGRGDLKPLEPIPAAPASAVSAGKAK